MPNWCDNELAIIGPAESLTKFLQGFLPNGLFQQVFPTGIQKLGSVYNFPGEDDGLNFEFIVPVPESLRAVDKGSDEMFYRILHTDESAHFSTREEAWEHFVNRDPRDEDELRAIAGTYKRNLEEHGYLTWYDFQIKNWGTKWEGQLVSIKATSPRRVELRFDTAWSPPEPLILSAAKLFPVLKFDLKYWEGGGGFKGRLTILDYHIINKWDDDYCGPRGG